MDRRQWAQRVSPDEANRRAAGRDRYNHRRRVYAEFRMLQVAKLLNKLGRGRGVQSRIARALAVNRATISRDVAAFRKAGVEEWNPMLDYRLYEARQRAARFFCVDRLTRDLPSLENVVRVVPNRVEAERVNRAKPLPAPPSLPAAHTAAPPPTTRRAEPLDGAIERSQHAANNYVAQNIGRLITSLLGVNPASR